MSNLIKILLLFILSGPLAAAPIEIWFPSSWRGEGEVVRKISAELSNKNGLQFSPFISSNYNEILSAFLSNKKAIVYAGSFIQSIIMTNKLGVPYLQGVTGEEMYCGVLIHNNSDNPADVLNNYPEFIAYAVGSSSGEVTAMIATNKRAKYNTSSHTSSLGALRFKIVKGAIVKNRWWDKNKKKYPGFKAYSIPDISTNRHHDNVVSMSMEVSSKEQMIISKAIKSSPELFKVKNFVDFKKGLEYTLSQMKKAGINPLHYRFE
jgi:hypothetical protein